MFLNLHLNNIFLFLLNKFKENKTETWFGDFVIV
jgi:hypothetical protein